MLTRREELEAERAGLIKANELAAHWGAAVGARHERIKEIDSELRRIERKPTRSGPLDRFEPVWLGQFDTFDDWVCNATRELTGHRGTHGEEIKAVCVDALGRRCHVGGDFMRARDEGMFPVRYFITGKIKPWVK